MTPAIFGIAGPVLSPEERAFFKEAKPAGYILFKRNCVDRGQMRALTDALRALEGREDVAILIDQEGGRVARMQPPEWPAFPAGAAFEALYDRAPASAIEAARANAEALGLMLADVGVSVDCAPILDVRQPDADAVIGDRAYGHDPMLVAAIGRAVLDGLAAAGIVGVIKHMPGHGRVRVDSHKALPVVDASQDALDADLQPFRTLARRARMGMTAHIVYPVWDAERPGTLSPHIVQTVIRKRIGFDGLLMTDDIDMKALSGTPAEKACGALAAGCDVVLDCWARMDEMVAIANAVPTMTDAAKARLAAAMADPAPGDPDRMAALIDKRDQLLALV